MNREIKFRAYIKNNERVPSETSKIVDVKSLHLGSKKAIIGYSQSKTSYGNYSVPFEDLELMQSTGLKDKNGVEIYEGDILRIPEWLWEDEQEYCVCIYQQENEVCDVYGFGLYIKDGYSGKYKVRVPSDEWDEFEVVGNIYDNPELIEKEGK